MAMAMEINEQVKCHSRCWMIFSRITEKISPTMRMANRSSYFQNHRFILTSYPALFISFRHEMFKYQKTQATADKFDAGNSELFSNQI
jgi:hypothetical protein